MASNTAPVDTAGAASAMTFPESPRVIYATNPLVEVICQLRFPPILRIDTEVPAAFQERIRKDYPLMEEALTAQFPVGFPFLQPKTKVPPFPAGRTYKFISEDHRWTLGIGRDYLSTSTTHYTRWEVFRSMFERALEAFRAIYAPAFVIRTGLRYRDVLKKSSDALRGLDWPEILQPHILGELASKDVSRFVQHKASEVIISLHGSQGQVRILHGLVREAGDTDFSYSIDSDFFCEERTELTNVFKLLDIFNREAGRLFRWSTTPVLHERLGPTQLT